VYVDGDVNHILFNVKHDEEVEPDYKFNESKPKVNIANTILEKYVGHYVSKLNNSNRLYHFGRVKITPENFIFHSQSLTTNNRLYAETEKKFFTVGVDHKIELIQ